MACPHTWNFVELTQEVKDKIAAEKRPKLSDKELAYPHDSRAAKEKGMRAQLRF